MKILIVRFSSIGDIVLTSPVVRMVKNQLEAEVHYLTKEKYAPLLKYNPFIDTIHLFRGDLRTTLAELKKEDFDLVVDLHHNLRTWLLKRQLRKPARSFFKANIEKWLMVRLKIDRLPKKHIVDRYLETLSPYGVSNDGEGLDHFYDRAVYEKTINLPAKFVVVSLGAAHKTKQIPFEKLDQLLQTTGVNFVLIGGKDVSDTGSRLKDNHPVIQDLTGKLSLDESAMVIDRSQGVITADTGMMHIAAALKKKMIVFWGNTIPEFGMYPYYGKHEIPHLNAEIMLSCRPCSKTGHASCPKKHFRCMKDQNMNLYRKEMIRLFGL